MLKLHFDSFIEKAINSNNKKQINKFQTTSELLEDTYQTIRSMAHVENDSDVHQSLVHSVKNLAANISNTNKLNIEVIDFGLDDTIHQETEFIIFRIIQELITNIIKHAKAENVSIDLNLFDNAFGLVVSDDGIGFDTEKTFTDNKSGIGLNSIKEKMVELNGTFVVDSSLENGTTIMIEIPLKQNII